MSDFIKISNGFVINIAFESINSYLRKYATEKNISNPWDYSQYMKIMDIASILMKNNKIELNVLKIKYYKK